MSNAASKKKLAKHKMNSRKIRSAITTAHQPALLKEETLNVKNMGQVISVAGKFERFMEEVHDHIDANEMPRQDGIRYTEYGRRHLEVVEGGVLITTLLFIYSMFLWLLVT